MIQWQPPATLILQQKNAPVPCRDESVNLAVPPCLSYLIVLVDPRQNLLAPSPSGDLAAMGCPDNAGPAEPSTAPNRSNRAVQCSAQGRTSAVANRAGLPVHDPASLAAFLSKSKNCDRVLFPVTADSMLNCFHYHQRRRIVKDALAASVHASLIQVCPTSPPDLRDAVHLAETVGHPLGQPA